MNNRISLSWSTLLLIVLFALGLGVVGGYLYPRAVETAQAETHFVPVKVAETKVVYKYLVVRPYRIVERFVCDVTATATPAFGIPTVSIPTKPVRETATPTPTATEPQVTVEPGIEITATPTPELTTPPTWPPSETPAPTTTPAPTKTPAPTTTPAPTDEPTPTPVPTEDEGKRNCGVGNGQDGNTPGCDDDAHNGHNDEPPSKPGDPGHNQGGKKDSATPTPKPDKGKGKK